MIILVSSFVFALFPFHYFLSVSSLFAPFVPFALLCRDLIVISSPLFRVYVRIYVPRLRSWCYLVATIRDGIPQAATVPPPFRTGTTVHILFCLLSSTRRTFIVACSMFCDHGLDFRKMSY